VPSGKAAPKGKQVFTNEDLPSPSASSESSGQPPPAAPEAAAGEDSSFAGGAPEAHWRQRAKDQRAAIRAAEELVKRLEDRVDALRNDRAPISMMDPAREQTRQNELAKALQDLEAARKALADARKTLDDLEDEARRKGVPPGWLRER
jgi:hypothetical protein